MKEEWQHEPPTNFLKEGSMRGQIKKGEDIHIKPRVPPPPPTANIKDSIKVGSKWWVKYSSSLTLYEETIAAITDKTITLSNGEPYFNNRRTYKREDIELVEEVR